ECLQSHHPASRWPSDLISRKRRSFRPLPRLARYPVRLSRLWRDRQTVALYFAAGLHRSENVARSGRQGMMLLALDKRIRVTDGSPYVIDRDVVLALHLVEAHSPGQTSEDNRYRQPRTENYGLPMTDLGINNNPIL